MTYSSHRLGHRKALGQKRGPERFRFRETSEWFGLLALVAYAECVRVCSESTGLDFGF